MSVKAITNLIHMINEDSLIKYLCEESGKKPEELGVDEENIKVRVFAVRHRFLVWMLNKAELPIFPANLNDLTEEDAELIIDALKKDSEIDNLSVKDIQKFWFSIKDKYDEAKTERNNEIIVMNSVMYLAVLDDERAKFVGLSQDGELELKKAPIEGIGFLPNSLIQIKNQEISVDWVLSELKSKNKKVYDDLVKKYSKFKTTRLSVKREAVELALIKSFKILEGADDESEVVVCSVETYAEILEAIEEAENYDYADRFKIRIKKLEKAVNKLKEYSVSVNGKVTLSKELVADVRKCLAKL